MNAEQKKFLAGYTCHILDAYPEPEKELQAHGIPQKLIKKIEKAFNLIFEVNQACTTHEQNTKDKPASRNP